MPQTLRDVSLVRYTAAEERLNAATHAVGAAAGIAALILTLRLTLPSGSPRHIVSGAVYCLSLIVLYTASTVYHALPADAVGLKKAARVVDHSMVAILIAGTATPCALVSLYNRDVRFCAAVLIIGWGSAAASLIAKLFFFETSKAFCMVLYIVSGAVMLACSLPFLPSLNPRAMRLLVLGCAVYLVGAVLFGVGARVKYVHALFHVFILAGSLLHFHVIYRYVLTVI